MTEIITDRKRQIALFTVMAMAFFLDGLDGTIVTIALPEMASDFGISTSDSSWVMTIYFMMMAGLILVFGKLADMGWIRKILVSGFVIFGASSLACGMSGSFTMMLVFRAVQGVGSAMLAATGILLVIRFLPESQRHFGMSLSVLGSSMGAAFGPVLGGILTENLDWSWIFFINAPVGILCALFALKAVPRDAPLDRAPFDYTGSAVLFLALIFGLYCVEALPSDGFNAYTSLSLASFAILAASFAVYERHNDHPVVDLGLFRLPKFALSVLAFTLLNACYMGALYLIPFLMKIELGHDTMASGLFMLIQAAVTLLLCLPVGRACDIHGTRVFAVTGCLCMAATFLMFAFTDAGTGDVMLVIGLILLGSVWGFSGASVGPRMVEYAPVSKSGSASALLSFIIYFGSAFGTALFSAFFNIGSDAGGISITDLPAPVFMDGFVFAMLCGTVLAAVSAAVSFCLRNDP